MGLDGLVVQDLSLGTVVLVYGGLVFQDSVRISCFRAFGFRGYSGTLNFEGSGFRHEALQYLTARVISLPLMSSHSDYPICYVGSSNYSWH